jgi:hypothetical protein
MTGEEKLALLAKIKNHPLIAFSQFATLVLPKCSLDSARTRLARAIKLNDPRIFNGSSFTTALKAIKDIVP